MLPIGADHHLAALNFSCHFLSGFPVADLTEVELLSTSIPKRMIPFGEREY